MREWLRAIEARLVLSERERERERIIMHASAAAKMDNWRPSQHLMYKNNNSMFRRAIIILHMSHHIGTLHCKLSVPMDLWLFRNYFMRTKKVESMNRTDGRHFSCSLIRRKKTHKCHSGTKYQTPVCKNQGSLVWIYLSSDIKPNVQLKVLHRARKRKL